MHNFLVIMVLILASTPGDLWALENKATRRSKSTSDDTYLLLDLGGGRTQTEEFRTLKVGGMFGVLGLRAIVPVNSNDTIHLGVRTLDRTEEHKSNDSFHFEQKTWYTATQMFVGYGRSVMDFYAWTVEPSLGVSYAERNIVLREKTYKVHGHDKTPGAYFALRVERPVQLIRVHGELRYDAYRVSMPNLGIDTLAQETAITLGASLNLGRFSSALSD